MMWRGLTQIEIEAIRKEAEEFPNRVKEIINQLLEHVPVIGYAPYDPNFGDLKVCHCGHHYHRHFDSWEENRPVGCKYCECWHYHEVCNNPDCGHRGYSSEPLEKAEQIKETELK